MACCISNTTVFTFFFAFQIVPLIWILFNSFQLEEGGWGLANFSEILNSSFYLQAIRYSLEISLWSSLFGLIIALFGSYSLSAVRPSRIGDFILSFNSMTSNFSGIPLAFAFIILLGANGAVNLLLRNYQVDTIDIYSKLGIIIIYTYFQIPLAVLLLYPAFEALKRVAGSCGVIGRKYNGILVQNCRSGIDASIVGNTGDFIRQRYRCLRDGLCSY